MIGINLISVGRATLERNVDVAIERAAREASSAMWNFGINSAFVLGERKTTKSLDRVRPRSLSKVYFKNSDRTSQETRYISATKTNRLMLFRETVAVYCESHTEHITALCGKNVEFSNVKSGGTCNYHTALTT
jgi:hypothetical protein